MVGMRRLIAIISTSILPTVLGGWAVLKFVLDNYGRADAFRGFAASDGMVAKGLGWLFSTPWWVPATLAFALIAFSVHFANRVLSAHSAQIPPVPRSTEACIAKQLGTVRGEHGPSPQPLLTTVPPSTSVEFRFSEGRIPAKRTSGELLAYYRQGLTPLQAGKLIKPYLGLWIEVKAKAHMILDGGQDVVAVVYEGGNMVECRFVKHWEDALMRINPGDTVHVIGQIGPSQNGAQLYIQNCELVP
jgi:hypothetical protein